MATNENIKRVGLYFNLENEYDNKMYAYLSKQGKKPKDEIKRLIELAMQGEEIQPLELKTKELKDIKDNLDKDEIDPSIGVGF